MHFRKDPYGDEAKEAAPQTPWIWNPATLSNDGASLSPNPPSSSESSDRTQSSRVRHYSEPYSQNNSVAPRARHATDPTPNGRRSADMGSNGSFSSTSHTASSSHNTPPFDRSIDRSNDSQFYPRRSIDEYQSPPTDQAPRASTPEDFTSRIQLKPTFSPKIIRTPGHYKNGRAAPHTNSREQSQGSMDSLTGRLDRMSTTDSASSSDSISVISRHSSMPSVYSSSNNSTASISGVSTLVDEPSSILSPLVIAAGTPKPGSLRPLGRGSTYPDLSQQSLSTIVEDTPRKRRSHHTPPDPYAPRRPSPNPQDPPSRRGSDAHPGFDPPRRSLNHQYTPPDTLSARSASSPSWDTTTTPRRPHGNLTPPDIYRPPSPSYTAPRPGASFHPQPHAHAHTPPPDPFASSRRPPSRPTSRDPSPRRSSAQLTPPHNLQPVTQPSPPGAAATPTRYGTYADNPLPVPPRSRNGLTYMPMPLPPRTGPPQYKRLRRGFWNRRGDHITPLGYIVYAPPDMAFPDELKGYPEDGKGYKDDFGMIAQYDPDRPELPESLPRHGQPPVHPYSEVCAVCCVDLWCEMLTLWFAVCCV